MGNGCDSGSALGIEGIVIACDGNILWYLKTTIFKRFNHLYSNLIIVADDSMRKRSGFYHFFYHHRWFTPPIFGVEPYYQIWIIRNTSLLQCPHIPFMSLDTLNVICLEKTGNPAVSLLQKVLCHQIAACSFQHRRQYDYRPLFAV